MSYQQTVTVYSVEERLPADGAVCVCWSGRWVTARYSDEEWFVDLHRCWVYAVTHWHELPGPPTGGKS